MDTNINTIKQVMVDTLVSMKKTDNSSKVLFNEAVTYLKDVKEVAIGVKALNNLIDETSETYTSHYKQRLRNIVKYASIAVKSKLMINTNTLLWYNVEKALKLMDHLMDNYVHDVVKIKNLLNGLSGKAVTKTLDRTDKNKYNELYSAKLLELYKEYKLEDDEETKGVKIEKVFATLSADAKASLIAKLQNMMK